MIDGPAEFLNKIVKYYDANEISIEHEDGIRVWLKKKKFKPVELETLYDLAVEKYKYIPKVSELADIWNKKGEKLSKQSDFMGSNNAIEFNKDKNWQAIIEELKYLRRKQDTQDLTCKEIDYLHEWDDLMYIHNMLATVPSVIMPQNFKDTYLRKVREDIIAHIPINLDRFSVKIQERVDQYNNIYKEQEREQDSKLEKTVADVERIFRVNSKILDPEPDRVLNFNDIQR